MRTRLISRSIVNRAKEVLHARAADRLSLNEVAAQVGVSPVYLTQTFTKAEGIPLHRYQLRLRLSRALVALPNCQCIHSLALELGFSSQSHFGSSFKSAFGMTAAQFRTLMRS
jgi:AraC-like DNA-binding protein